MAHITNIIVVVLSKLPLVSCIEFMLQSLYSFFAYNPKKFLEFIKLANFGNQRVEIVEECEDMMDLHVEPFETCISPVQVFGCEYAF
jgi:hypothetical protein